MRHRAWRILCLCFTTLWFVVLVPAHQRGAIPVPGDGAAHVMSCCAGGTDSSRTHASRDGKQSPAGPERSSHSCAVCQFIAGLDVPPPLVIDAPPLRLAPLGDAPRPSQSVPFLIDVTPIQERAPPVASLV
jgi:hypothetical protein